MRSRTRSLVALVAMVSAACGPRPPAPGTGPLAGPTPTSAATGKEGGGGGPDPDAGGAPGFFYPRTAREGHLLVMPLTFVDGSTAEIVFPPSLGLQRMGGLHFQSGGLVHVDRGTDVRHGDGSEFLHRGPLETYEGYRGGAVEVWEPRPGGFQGPHLVYRFGEWFVGVDTERLTESDKRTWARSLVGRETSDGWLVLDALPPLVLAKAGQHGGPELVLAVHGGGPFILFDPGPCRPPEPGEEESLRRMDDGTVVGFSHIGSKAYATWCEGGAMRVQVNEATDAFAEAAARGLRARDISLAAP